MVTRGDAEPDIFHLDFDGAVVRDMDEVVLAGLDDPRHLRRVPALTAMLGDPDTPALEQLYALYTLASWGEIRGYEGVVAACGNPDAVPWRDMSIDRLFSQDNTFGMLATAITRNDLALEKATEPRRLAALAALVSVADRVYFDGQLDWALGIDPADGAVTELVAAVGRGVDHLRSGEPPAFDVATQLVDLVVAITPSHTALAVGLALDVVHAAPDHRVLRHAAELTGGTRNAAVDDFREYLATIGDDTVRARLAEVAARTVDDAEPPFHFFGSVPPGRTRDNPAGVVRRRLVDGDPSDEVFTRALRWEPTTAMIEQQFGHGDTEYVEITEAEAEQFVDRITRKLNTGR